MHKLKDNEYRIVWVITDVYDVNSDYLEVHTKREKLVFKDKSIGTIRKYMRKRGFKRVK